MNHFGVNYGLVFNACGVGGFVFSRVYQMITSGTEGQSSTAFMVAGCLLILGVGIAFLIKRNTLDRITRERLALNPI
jgi:uncharacterized membrane protein